MNVLKQIKACSKRIDGLKKQYDETYSRLTAVTYSVDKPSITASPDLHKFDQIAVAQDNLNQAIYERQSLLIYVLKWMYGCPELSSRERIIILQRYFVEGTYREIAKSIDYSPIQIKSTH